MRNYSKHIILLIKRLLLLVVIFQISRIIFYAFNYHYFNISFIEFLNVSFFGIRFDWFTIVIVNSIFIVLHLIPGDFKNFRNYQRILFIYFIVINSIVLLFNYLDVEYFKFTNKRTTADFFQLISTGDDTWVLLPQFIKDFWYVVLLWITTVLIMWVVYKKILQINLNKIEINIKQYFLQIFISACIGGLLFLSVRGYGYRPTGIISAARYTSSQNLPLILNTPFTIIKTLYKDDLSTISYFNNEEIEKIYTPVLEYNKDSCKNINVIVIILESFSKEYIGYYNKSKSFTPFLDSLINQSMSCEYSFANGKKSMEAMPAIISGIPSLMDNPFITSSYSSDNISSLARTLKEHGYHTSFFHGGTNGTMGFDNFANLAGIEKYYGKSEYPNIEDFDGKWGIFDEPFLQYYANTLNNFKQPFFSSVFTLSSHHPYTVPEKYINKFKGGNDAILKSVEYTDYALMKFFETISEMDWYENTLFVITADHTSTGMSPYYHNTLGLYAVPVIYFCPSDTNLIGKNYTITQQTDIFPSVLDYLGVSANIVAFGNSIFDNTAEHFAVSYLNGIYHLIQDDYLLSFDGENSISIFNFKKDSLLSKNLIFDSQNMPIKKIKLENKLKAIIQQFNNRLIKNQLFVK